MMNVLPAVDGMKILGGNQSSQYKLITILLCLSQITQDVGRNPHRRGEKLLLGAPHTLYHRMVGWLLIIMWVQKHSSPHLESYPGFLSVGTDGEKSPMKLLGLRAESWTRKAQNMMQTQWTRMCIHSDGPALQVVTSHKTEIFIDTPWDPQISYLHLSLTFKLRTQRPQKVN
jgi:hypothetical protein